MYLYWLWLEVISHVRLIPLLRLFLIVCGGGMHTKAGAHGGKKALDSLERVTFSCEPLDVGAGKQVWVLCKSDAHSLTGEPPARHPNFKTPTTRKWSRPSLWFLCLWMILDFVRRAIYRVLSLSWTVIYKERSLWLFVVFLIIIQPLQHAAGEEIKPAVHGWVSVTKHQAKPIKHL